jgi:nitrogen fixation protein NifB
VNRSLPLRPLLPLLPLLTPTSRVGAGCAKKSSCGLPSTGLDEATKARVAAHPCYNQEAHQYYARMHLAVAPSCNVQCNYCNRKFDCVNESRPGVTSKVLSPEEALAKVAYVAAKVPQLSVVGIAGPGDPLANANRTFRTFELIARDFPDLKLCLSTNGLKLPENVARIIGLGIDHVTITMNYVDPKVGAGIYAWVAHEGRQLTGVEAAQVLLDRQLAGLRALVAAGVLVKINSVMIPGINDAHLPEVARLVKAEGAFVHNVLPLISEPEHGTYFGLTGQRAPTGKELKALQDTCEDDDGPGMQIMRHCRQCRADAVGMLGADEGESFGPELYLNEGVADDTERLMKSTAVRAEIEQRRAELATIRDERGIATEGAGKPERVVLVAVASTGLGRVNQHFGQAEEFWIYEAAPGWARFVQARNVRRYCSGLIGCDDDPSALGKLVEMLSDCAAVITAEIGPPPREALEQAGIHCITIADDADDPESVIEVAVEAAGAALVAVEVAGEAAAAVTVGTAAIAAGAAQVTAELVTVGGVR